MGSLEGVIVTFLAPQFHTLSNWLVLSKWRSKWGVRQWGECRRQWGCCPARSLHSEMLLSPFCEALRFRPGRWMLTWCGFLYHSWSLEEPLRRGDSVVESQKTPLELCVWDREGGGVGKSESFQQWGHSQSQGGFSLYHWQFKVVLICLSIGCIHRSLYLIYILHYLLSIHASMHLCINAPVHACMHLASICSSIILSSTHYSSINSSVLLHDQPLFLPLEYVSFITYPFMHSFSGVFWVPESLLGNQGWVWKIKDNVIIVLAIGKLIAEWQCTVQSKEPSGLSVLCIGLALEPVLINPLE